MEAAVVSATHGAMASLLGKLGELLTANYKLLKEAKGQIMFLKAELESMHVFLKKISDTEEPDEQDKFWAKEVRELSYDIEDSVNGFMLRVEHDSNKPHGFKGFITRSTKLLTTMNNRHEIAKEFEGLKIRVQEVSERHKRYKIDVPKTDNTTIDPRLLAVHAETAGLVGIEGPRDELIHLMDEEGEPARQLKVLSIVGFGGLGKTTLANEIYRNLEGKFQCRAFVSVSQKPNIRKILRTILSQVGFEAPKDNSMEMWEEPELISALRKFLFDQRYLIVIDDIWDASDWDIIRCALPENMGGSRVITTTRIETVARACCRNNVECVYNIKALSDQDSRILFFKRIFGSEDACPPYLKEVSVEILKKCGGLPLAVITLSSLLANQPYKQKEQWKYVLKSLGSNIEVSPSLNGMRQILNLSYINLPRYLKTCMLYLGSNSKENIEGLRELTNLTDLVITVDKVVERAGREVLLMNCLEKLFNLKYLGMYFRIIDAQVDALSSVPASFCHLQRFHGSMFSTVPGWIGKLYSLYDLGLGVKEVLQDDVEMLAQLPSLMYLRLHIHGASKDKILIRGGSGFPVLKHFEVRCSRISCLTFGSRAMPKLERLELGFNARGWDRYGAAPGGIEHLSSLKGISADIGGLGAKESNTRAAESALRDAIDMHPGRPVASIKLKERSRWLFDYCMDADDEPDYPIPRRIRNGGNCSRST